MQLSGRPQRGALFVTGQNDMTAPKLAAVVTDIADEMRERADRGEVAHYIPELAQVDPKHFGIVVIDDEGNVACGGDCDMPFSIQSVSKVFTLTLALGRFGDRLWRLARKEKGPELFAAALGYFSGFGN